MKILSHRGYWKDFKESNQTMAFERSFEMGFGTETDLRDIMGKIVVSHDMPKGNEISFEELLQIMNGRNLPLALNIKADGQAHEIERLLKKYNHTNYFTFDMSLPEMVYQVKNTSLKIFTGYSDINMSLPLIEKARGVWLDAFNDMWYSQDQIQKLLSCGKEVCIVSEDLHKRENEKQWKLIKESSFINDDRVMLCTNYPENAKIFFDY